jgi:hypothetical protein
LGDTEDQYEPNCAKAHMGDDSANNVATNDKRRTTE